MDLFAPFRGRRAHVAVLALLLGAGTPAIALAQQAPPSPPPPKVVAAEAQERVMAPRVVVPGTVRSRQDAVIAAEVAGRVTWIAEAGTRLRAGDPIARLDDRELSLRAEELDAQIRSLQAQLGFQSREAQRLEKLAAGNNATISRLEESQTRRDTLTQDLARMKVQRERVALDLQRTVVRAPFDGQIAARSIEVGEFSSPGARIARLVAVDDVEIRAQAPVALAPLLREGMEVELGEGEARRTARISRIIPIGESQSRTFEVRIAVPDGRWIVGGAVRIALPSGEPQTVVAVHRDALVLRSGGTFLFRVNAENKAERLTIRTGTENGEWVEVLGGVAIGDRVVIRGAERLRDGQAVDTAPRLS